MMNPELRGFYVATRTHREIDPTAAATLLLYYINFYPYLLICIKKTQIIIEFIYRNFCEPKPDEYIHKYVCTMCITQFLLGFILVFLCMYAKHLLFIIYLNVKIPFIVLYCTSTHTILFASLECSSSYFCFYFPSFFCIRHKTMIYPI